MFRISAALLMFTPPCAEIVRHCLDSHNLHLASVLIAATGDKLRASIQPRVAGQSQNANSDPTDEEMDVGARLAVASRAVGRG
jgi:hypothetical protein